MRIKLRMEVRVINSKIFAIWKSRQSLNAFYNISIDFYRPLGNGKGGDKIRYDPEKNTGKDGEKNVTDADKGRIYVKIFAYAAEEPGQDFVFPASPKTLHEKN